MVTKSDNKKGPKVPGKGNKKETNKKRRPRLLASDYELFAQGLNVLLHVEETKQVTKAKALFSGFEGDTYAAVQAFCKENGVEVGNASVITAIHAAQKKLDEYR